MGPPGLMPAMWGHREGYCHINLGNLGKKNLNSLDLYSIDFDLLFFLSCLIKRRILVLFKS